MRDLHIAYGNSCFAKTWANKTTSFKDLCDRLSTTIRTTESMEEYPKLPKAERDRTKDKGGFVGGLLRDNRRKRDTVACRSMLTLDCDHGDTDIIDRFVAGCKYAACLYTTHGHTPEAPRIRIIVPLTRDVSPDEFTAISRYFADEWGIDQFDECSYRPHQLMYWPTTSANGEFICKTIDGDWLDPDIYLLGHPNWQDCSLLPTSSRESTVRKQDQKKQEDPLTKSGIVGSFCRAYSITAAIDNFLSDIYEESAVEGRYDYKPADSSAGVVIYDDKFAYSHHATDPACGKLLNAFDLVRIHKFGDDDEKKSFNAACEFAMELDEVKRQLAAERMEQAGLDFDDDDDWQRHLQYNKRGQVADTVENEMLILSHDPDFANFAFNDMAKRVQITGPVPWERPLDNHFWRDADTTQLIAILDKRYTPFSTRNHNIAFTNVAENRHFHPVRDYLDGLPEWDGVKRLDTVLIRYMAAEDTEYVRTVTRKAFTGAVARIYQPGIKFDCVLVMDGAQGIGKSSLFKDMVGEEYYSETLSLTDMSDKTGAEKLQGYWVIEIPELSGMKKADIEKVKAFISTTDDKYRPSYGKTVESHLRQCIIVATVNGERGYLRDITGNRRFWIVKLHQELQQKTYSISSEERDLLWAEAKHYYEHGEKLYLEGDLLSSAEEAQRGAMEVDERQGMVEEYLETLLPDNWADMDLYARKEYLANKDAPTSPKGTVRRQEVSNAEVWCECFGRSLSDMRPTDSYSIAALMTQVDGWQRTDKVKRLPMYGRQRLYMRSCEQP